MTAWSAGHGRPQISITLKCLITRAPSDTFELYLCHEGPVSLQVLRYIELAFATFHISAKPISCSWFFVSFLVYFAFCQAQAKFAFLSFACPTLARLCPAPENSIGPRARLQGALPNLDRTTRMLTGRTRQLTPCVEYFERVLQSSNSWLGSWQAQAGHHPALQCLSRPTGDCRYCTESSFRM